MTGMPDGIDALYRGRKGKVQFIEVPKLGYVVIRGQGDPEGPEFAEAIHALYAVSYGAHFLLKKQFDTAPRVMPLEALWWVEDPKRHDVVLAVAMGTVGMAHSRDQWQWQAMIMQPDPIDEGVVAEAVGQAQKKGLPALNRLYFERWEEGRCAQILHVGSYAAEGPDILQLHDAIVAAGYQPYGRHHEIYLGDPRRVAPERLRTLLRHPITAQLRTDERR